MNSNLIILDFPHNIRMRLAQLNFLLPPDVAKSLPCWLSQFSFSKLRQPTGQRLSNVRTQQKKLFSNVIFCHFKFCHNRKKSLQHLFMTWLTFTTYLCFFLAILCPIFWNLPEKTSFWNPLLNFYGLGYKAFYKINIFVCKYIFTKLFGNFMNQKSGKMI